MALGLGFGLGFGRVKTVRTINAPSIEWNDVDTDSTPDFDVLLPFGSGAPFDAANGDVLRLQYSSDGGSNWNAYLTHTLTSGEIAGAPFTVSSVTPLANTSYLFRARLERVALFSGWSASESVTVNAVAVLPYFTVMFH